jgi:hypothetical protein
MSMNFDQSCRSRGLLAAMTLLLFCSLPANAQEWNNDELQGPRIFIGLTKGNLRSDSDEHLRTYIALEKLARELQRRLNGNALIKAVNVGDMERKPKEKDIDWKVSAERKYTHYLIAEPEVKSITLVEVRWKIGKLSESKELAAEVVLRRPTQISIPSTSDEQSSILTTSSIQTSDLPPDEAGRLFTEFEDMFPEVKLEPKYAIRCIGDLTGWPTAPHAHIMAWLSSELQYPQGPVQRWTSAKIITRDDADALCKGSSSDRLPQADLIIGGWLVPIVTMEKRRFQSKLALTYTMGERRKLLAVIYRDIDVSKKPRLLEDFCFDEGTTLKNVLDDLVHYIQAHREGLNIRGIRHAPLVACN